MITKLISQRRLCSPSRRTKSGSRWSCVWGPQRSIESLEDRWLLASDAVLSAAWGEGVSQQITGLLTAFDDAIEEQQELAIGGAAADLFDFDQMKANLNAVAQPIETVDEIQSLASIPGIDIEWASTTPNPDGYAIHLVVSQHLVGANSAPISRMDQIDYWQYVDGNVNGSFGFASKDLTVSLELGVMVDDADSTEFVAAGDGIVLDVDGAANLSGNVRIGGIQNVRLSGSASVQMDVSIAPSREPNVSGSAILDAQFDVLDDILLSNLSWAYRFDANINRDDVIEGFTPPDETTYLRTLVDGYLQGNKLTSPVVQQSAQNSKLRHPGCWPDGRGSFRRAG